METTLDQQNKKPVKHRSPTFHIAEKTNVSERTVRRHLEKDPKHNPGSWYTHLSDEAVVAAIADINQGKQLCPAQPLRAAPPFGQLRLPFE